MSQWIDRYLAVEAKDLPKAEPQAPNFGIDMALAGGQPLTDPVERTQNTPGGRRDRQARPINDAFGQAYNVSYFDGAGFDQKVAACNQPTLRITDMPKDVSIAFWKDTKGHFFFFPNGQDNKKPHYIPANVTKIEVVQNGAVHAQDVARMRIDIDDAFAKEAAKPKAPIVPPPGRAQPGVAQGGRGLGAGGDLPPVAPPNAGDPGKYANGKSWHTPYGGGDMTVSDISGSHNGLNRFFQRSTTLGADVYFANMALKDVAPLSAKFRTNTVGVLAGGEIAKYVIDRQFFPNANPSLRTYLIDGAAPAIVLTKLHPLAKAGVIVGAHVGARLWDASEKR